MKKYDVAVIGGGFAGTVQAYVPLDMVSSYITAMDSVFGKGATLELNIRPVGVTEIK